MRDYAFMQQSTEMHLDMNITSPYVCT